MISLMKNRLVRRFSPNALIFSIAFVVVVAPAEARTRCEKLAKLNLPHTDIALVEAVPAGKFRAPLPDGVTYKVPAFCRVRLVAKPTVQSNINIEVWLPEKYWNGRYFQLAMGGRGGIINYESLAGMIANGTAVATTDSGVPPPPFIEQVVDGKVRSVRINTTAGGVPKLRAAKSENVNFWDWAANSPERIIDFGYRAHKETSDSARALIKAYYGKSEDYAYIRGCSRGGISTLNAIMRYPEEWDGALAGDGSVYFGRPPAQLITNIYQLNHPEGWIPPSKLPAIQNAALAACRPEAHVVNGVAGDPRLCRYDPVVLQCKGQETDQCLTGPQVETLRRIYDGPRHPKTGQKLAPGYPPTMEASPDILESWGWAGWVTGREPMTAEQFLDRAGLIRAMVYDGDPDTDLTEFDYDQLLADAKNKILPNGENVMQTNGSFETDWRKVMAKGVKVIRYTGWGDAVGSEHVVKEYEEAVDQVGDLEVAMSFHRLFMAPGMFHCANGPGPSSFGQFRSGRTWSPPQAWDDNAEPAHPLGPTEYKRFDPDYDLIAALEKWVEQGVAPEQVIGAHYVDDNPDKGVEFERPICVYPNVRAYKGGGSKDLAENYECVPGAHPPDK